MGRFIHAPEPRTPEQDARLSATLRAHRVRRGDPVAEARARIPEMFHDLAIRPLDAFRPPRTDDVDRLALALARHAFARFRTPEHLNAVWAEPAAAGAALDRQLKVMWTYVTAAGGGSVYREHLRGILSRREVHAFLAVPGIPDYSQALWYAVARSHTDDHGQALMISRSKLSDRSRDAVPEWWREVVRLFARHPARDVHQIDDVIDYLIHRRNLSPGYSVSGRSLASLVDATAQWHRALARAKVIGNVVWEGVAMPDLGMERRHDGTPTRYEMVQITCGRDLAAEGTAQRHCVLSYMAMCVDGTRSIWSLRREDGKRLLTVELDNADREVAQVRGLANRQPHPWESALVDEWMRANGLTPRSRRHWC